MSEYTPTMPEVRGHFASDINRFGDGFGTFEYGWAMFDRWLKAHDAQVAKETERRLRADYGLRSVADVAERVWDECDDAVGEYWNGESRPYPGNPYRFARIERSE